MACFAMGEMAKESRWALKTWSRPLPPKFVAIKLAIAWAMASRDGDDVCGCRMAAIEFVIVVALFDANRLIRSDKAVHDVARKKMLPKTRSTRVSIMIVNRLANKKVIKLAYDWGYPAHSMDFARFVNLPSFSKLYRLIVNLSLRIVCIT